MDLGLFLVLYGMQTGPPVAVSVWPSGHKPPQRGTHYNFHYTFFVAAHNFKISFCGNAREAAAAGGEMSSQRLRPPLRKYRFLATSVNDGGVPAYDAMRKQPLHLPQVPPRDWRRGGCRNGGKNVRGQGPGILQLLTCAAQIPVFIKI